MRKQSGADGGHGGHGGLSPILLTLLDDQLCFNDLFIYSILLFPFIFTQSNTHFEVGILWFRL